MVDRIGKVMDQSVTPNSRYEIGIEYHGQPIWKKRDVFVRRGPNSGEP